MFNLNENNRIVMAQQPTDMRKGVNTLCGQVRLVGLDPADGEVGQRRRRAMAAQASASARAWWWRVRE